MIRFLGFALLLIIAFPAQAQLRAFDNPAVWLSTSFGFFPWTSSDLNVGERDNFIADISVGVASPKWMVQGGAQVSGYFDPVFAGSPLPSLSGDADRMPITYRTAYAVAGPWTKSQWFMAGAAVGPALTWGTLVREIRSPPCPPDAELCLYTPFSEYETERYLNPGLAGSVQGFVRLDGRLWIGGETMLVANTSSTHLATRFALRVDLLRPER